MKTPRETIQELCKQYYEYSGVGCSHQFDTALAELESYYVLSNDELRDIIYVAIQDLSHSDKDNALLYKNLVTALQGRVPKEMSAEETIERIMAKLKAEGKGLFYLNGEKDIVAN